MFSFMGHGMSPGRGRKLLALVAQNANTPRTRTASKRLTASQYLRGWFNEQTDGLDTQLSSLTLLRSKLQSPLARLRTGGPAGSEDHATRAWACTHQKTRIVWKYLFLRGPFVGWFEGKDRETTKDPTILDPPFIFWHDISATCGCENLLTKSDQ